MTRINVGIPPQQLSDKRLMAEHREIKRIPNTIISGKAKMEGIPSRFTLGKGHVKFFYDKIGFLGIRYKDILKECQYRGHNVTDYTEAFLSFPSKHHNHYKPTFSDKMLIYDRIIQIDQDKGRLQRFVKPKNYCTGMVGIHEGELFELVWDTDTRKVKAYFPDTGKYTKKLKGFNIRLL